MEQDLLHKLLCWVALNVQLRLNYCFKSRNIAVPDMSLVRSGMNSDAIRPKRLAIPGYLDEIRSIPSPTVSDQGDFIDIYTEVLPYLDSWT